MNVFSLNGFTFLGLHTLKPDQLHLYSDNGINHEINSLNEYSERHNITRTLSQNESNDTPKCHFDITFKGTSLNFVLYIKNNYSTQITVQCNIENGY